MKRINLNVNETKKYKVIKAVSEKKKKKLTASVELGLTIRQINRLVKVYQINGKKGFEHGNRNVKPKHAMTNQTRERIIEIYLAFSVKPNIKYFTEILTELHDIHYTDTTIRNVLYQANIISPKSQRKTRKRIQKQIKVQKLGVNLSRKSDE